jgi:SAM-dependent methyltransferase
MTESSSSRPVVGQSVRSFYEEMPFNYYDSTEAAADYIRTNPVEASYPDLHALLSTGEIETVLEFGCGAGWLSNSLALHYGLTVTAVDFTSKALKRARAVSELLGVDQRTTFVESNIFDFEESPQVDLVISLGVLHHTGDCRGAYRHIQKFAGSGAFVYVGLYHFYGRREFLRIFQEMLEDGSEKEAFEHYRELDGVRQGDATHMLSWFRDQVLHPHETQHTFKELTEWCAEDGLTIQSTSINGFQPLGALPPLFESEKEYEARSHQANVVEKRYFPGFFVVMSQRV